MRGQLGGPRGTKAGGRRRPRGCTAHAHHRHPLLSRWGSTLPSRWSPSSITKDGAAYSRRCIQQALSACLRPHLRLSSCPVPREASSGPGPDVASPPGPRSLLSRALLSSSRIAPTSGQTQLSEPLSGPRAPHLPAAPPLLPACPLRPWPPWHQAQPSWTGHRPGSPAHSPRGHTHTLPGLRLPIWPRGSKAQDLSSTEAVVTQPGNVLRAGKSSLSTVSSASRESRHSEGEGKRTGKQPQPLWPPPPLASLLRNLRERRASPLQSCPAVSPGPGQLPLFLQPLPPFCPHPAPQTSKRFQALTVPPHPSLLDGLRPPPAAPPSTLSLHPGVGQMGSPLPPATSEARRGPAGSRCGRSRAPVTGGPWQPQLPTCAQVIAQQQPPPVSAPSLPAPTRSCH